MLKMILCCFQVILYVGIISGTSVPSHELQYHLSKMERVRSWWVEFELSSWMSEDSQVSLKDLKLDWKIWSWIERFEVGLRTLCNLTQREGQEVVLKYLNLKTSFRETSYIVIGKRRHVVYMMERIHIVYMMERIQNREYTECISVKSVKRYKRDTRDIQERYKRGRVYREYKESMRKRVKETT